MLTDLKGYLTERGGASLTEMATRFATEPEALRPMLDVWIRKGKVRRSGGDRCHGCCACAAADVEFYEWVSPLPAAKPRPTPDAG
ncbi:MAG: hypothetical protein EA405_09850 [Rhodospirillales bacterium]|nr:MAG: hypothetical protein EA405_09850 [Rhodospirillales bacterium]